MQRRMTPTDIKSALQRASEDVIGDRARKMALSTPKIKMMARGYNSKTFDAKTKIILKRKLGLSTRRDYLTLYTMYRAIFPYMNIQLYNTLLREPSLDSRLKQTRDSLKDVIYNNDGKGKRGGFIFSAIIASIAAGVAGAAATTAATVATTAATVGTAIAGSSIASAVVGGVATAAATAGVEAIVDAIKK